MRIVVIGTCQADMLARCLRLMLPVDRIEFVSLRALKSKAVVLGEAVAGADVVFARSGVGTARLDRIGMRGRDAPRVFAFPCIFFTGYHPDVVILQHRSSTPAPMASCCSAIALAGFLSGRSVDETLALYDRPTFRRLGYFDHWSAACEDTLSDAARSGLDLRADITAWALRGPFMHNPLHPCLFVIASIARKLLAAADIEPVVRDPENLMQDPLKRGGIWPVYPGIAEAVGLEGGDYRFVFDTRPDGSLDAGSMKEYLERAFAYFESVPRDVLMVERLKDARFQDLGTDGARRARKLERRALRRADATMEAMSLRRAKLASEAAAGRKVVCEEELLDPGR